MYFNRLRYTLLALFACAAAWTSAASAAPVDTAALNLEAHELMENFHRQYAAMEVDSAMNTLSRIIEINRQLGDVDSETSARWNMIALLNNSAHYDTLVTVAEDNRIWFAQHGVWNRHYQAWQRKCSAYHDMGRMQSSLREARLMRDDAQQRDNNFGRAMAYKQMGIVYFDIRQMSQAQEAFEHGIELLKIERDSTGILSGLYDGLCQTLDRSRQYERELSVADEWLDHLAVVLMKKTIQVVAPTYVSCHLAHSSAYIGLGRLDEAEESLRQAVSYYEANRSSLPLYYIYEMYARIALARGQANRALEYVDSTLTLGINVDEKIREVQADALMMAGRGREAAEIYRGLYDRKDSLFTRDMRTQLDELNTLFRLDELKAEQREEQMRYLAVIGGLVLLALGTFLFVRWRAAVNLARKNRELAEKNEQLEVANAKAEESSKMKTEFIKTISHEIRTPLNVLSGFSQILTSGDIELSAEEKTDARRRMEENTQRMTGLVNKMLELADASSHSVIDRTDATTPLQVATMAAHDAGVGDSSDVAFNLSVPHELTSINLQTNETYAVRALVLLLDNALKFCPAGGGADAAGGKSKQKGSVRLAVDRRKGSDGRELIEFAVEDTGIGVPPEQSERIFEEFVQLDNYSDGTGIGLTVARSIARRLGGDVTLDTAYTTGARFVLSLPL